MGGQSGIFDNPDRQTQALNVAPEKRPGLYSDGRGLYLHVTKSGSKSWIFWLNSGTRGAREVGFGSLIAVSLLEARADVRSSAANHERGSRSDRST